MTTHNTLDDRPGATLQSPAGVATPQERRRPGRPLEMSRSMVLETIRRLALRDEGLFRIHHTHGALYARARRLYGSWSAAVAEAGVDYGKAVETARERATRSRSERARTRRL